MLQREYAQDRDSQETIEKNRGRIERREMTTTTVLNEFLAADWPDVAQVCKIVRRREVDGEQSVEVEYAITSVPRSRGNVSQLLTWCRQHWHIENKLHYVRDVTMDEDGCRIRSGTAPQILASLRNAAITLLRALGTENIAQALRENAWHSQRLFTKLGILKN